MRWRKATLYKLSVVLVLLNIAWFAFLLHRARKDTRNSRFKPSDRVYLPEKFLESIEQTGGHMPYHAEILRVRRHPQFRFEYDVMTDCGEILTGVFQHNIAGPKIDHDTHPRGKSIVKSVEDLSSIK